MLSNEFIDMVVVIVIGDVIDMSYLPNGLFRDRMT